MILNRRFYNKVIFWKSWWYQWQVRKFAGESVFKWFKLHRTEWPTKLYYYSPKLRKKPVFTGSYQELSLWKESKICEKLCPTKAITVTHEAILIDHRSCISCGLCVELAPKGLLKLEEPATGS